MSSPVIEIVREMKQTELTWVEHLEWKVNIVACVRQNSRGAFLKAVTNKGQRRGARLTVDFTGNGCEQTTEFYIGQKDTPGQNTFLCHIGGQKYYLCADDNEVFLMGSVDSEPSDARFLFHVERASSNFRNIKSAVNPEMFLVTDESGKAAMRKIKGAGRTTYDRQAWFRFIPS